MRAASRTASPQARAALESLCTTYWPPVHAYIRRSGHSADGGIFDGSRKAADLARIVQRTSREDVSEIRVAGRRKGKKRLAVIVAGSVLGAPIFIRGGRSS